MVVDSWLHRAARRHPGRRAVNDVTYAELLERARRVPVEPGARVGLALPPGEDYAIALHACLLAGALAVPIDLRLTEAERPAVDVLIDGALPEGPPMDVRGHDLDAPASRQACSAIA